MPNLPQGFDSLAAFANENPEGYRGLSVRDRLSMLQGQLGDGAELSDADMGLLQLLRARRERENAANAPQPAPAAPPGLLERLFGSLQQANPFDQVADQLNQ